MDIEMIRFTGLLSIMLTIIWIIITVFFIIFSKDNKTKDQKNTENKEPKNDLNKYKNDGDEIMNKLSKTLTKNQAIAYMVVAFNNFLNSGNISSFDISTIELFITGAMEAHSKDKIVEYSKELIEKNKSKMKVKIERQLES